MTIPGIFSNSNTVMDIAWAIAMGKVSAPGLIASRANGYVAATTVAIVAVRGSTYTPQASAAQRSIKSSSASDSPAGTGVQTVAINYLDSNMVLKQDTVNLNGLTAVNTNATDIQFIESMVCTASGSGLTNAGNIQLLTGTGGTGSVWAQINTGDTQTFYAHHYVPAGVTCYVVKYEGAGTLAVGRSFLHRTGDPRLPNTIPLTQIGDIVVHAAGFEEDHEYKVPLPVTGPDLIIAKEFPIAANASNIAYASFDYVQF